MKLQGNYQVEKKVFLFLYDVPVCMCQYSSKKKKNLFPIFENSDEHTTKFYLTEFTLYVYDSMTA